jgi:hypothetical protein
MLESSRQFLVAEDLCPAGELEICGDDEWQAFEKFRA